MHCNMIGEDAYRIRSVLRVIFKRKKKDRLAAVSPKSAAGDRREGRVYVPTTSVNESAAPPGVRGAMRLPVLEPPPPQLRGLARSRCSAAAP
jgi:hypothetical protein